MSKTNGKISLMSFMEKYVACTKWQLGDIGLFSTTGKNVSRSCIQVLQTRGTKKGTGTYQFS